MLQYSVFSALVSIFFVILSSPCVEPSHLASIYDVFDIQQTVGNYDGSCHDDERSALESWWRECYEVLTHTLIALESVRDPRQWPDLRIKELRLLLHGFYNVPFSPLGIPEGDILANIDNQIRTVVNFMEGRNTRRRFQKLFCNSLWLKETEQAYSRTGDRLLKPDGRPMSIRESPEIQSMFPDVQTKTVADPEDEWAIYLYWSQDFRQYESCPAYRRERKDVWNRRHFCVTEPGVAAILGQVSDEFRLGSALTLCPYVWTSDLFTFDTVNGALNSLNVKRPDQRLQRTLPRMTVLLHELFHFANGHDATADNGYGFTSIYPNRENQPWRLPETNLYFSWAYFLSSMAKPSMEWSTGLSRSLPDTDSEPEAGLDTESEPESELDTDSDPESGLDTEAEHESELEAY